MRRVKKGKSHEKEPNLERWLVSYADFITLFFAVFVMLYAMSIVDEHKIEEVQASIQASFSSGQNSPPPRSRLSGPGISACFPTPSISRERLNSRRELSTARANSIVHYPIEKHGFKGARLSVVGYAEYRPIADNATDQGRQLNRWVDIVMLSRKGAQGEALTSGGK